ncbi:MAG: flagellar basal body L-ring protein FlgH [Proteobacteria bacterium]|nr:flagellar basal body L-ring protein FlgH [Pseudomonadota bacterium]
MNISTRAPWTAILLLSLALTACAGIQASQPTPAANQEAALKTPPPVALRNPPRARTEGSIFSSQSKPNFFTDLRATEVGDIITINVVESSKASKEASTTLSRNNSVTGSINGLLGYETEIPTNRAGYDLSTGLGASYKSGFKGAGKTSRNESMTAQISARVLQVLPNGNLLIRGSREIEVNYEKQYIIIQGVIRPEDVEPDNTILSSYIADARIEYTGKGDVSGKQRPGWLSRLIEYIWPF